MPSTLIVGATRGLGQALVSHYATQRGHTVYATARAATVPADREADRVSWITGIDLSRPDCGARLAAALRGRHVDTCIITAGYFATETLGAARWDDEVHMYTVSAVAPVFVVEALVGTDVVARGAKVVLVSSESGSMTLRHAQEGGGNFAHHGSKAALNMVAKQLSLDLHDRGITIVSVHPSFMRTDMTRGVGFDRFWDAGGALEPADAARILADWVERDLSMAQSGSYWAPRGTRDIGNWDVVMGADTATDGPVQLPW